MTQVEHIVWETHWDSSDILYGICEIQVCWHGGDSDVIVLQGSYYASINQFKNDFMALNQDTMDAMGISGISLKRIGRIIG